MVHEINQAKSWNLEADFLKYQISKDKSVETRFGVLKVEDFNADVKPKKGWLKKYQNKSI